ncbi:DNA-formamidopyrimidine glycosylase family protein [Microbacterium sp. CFBP9034]|uniref:DNA-formamidopyrimidine glycosylase family protein n=1 Tax=Microbacterium sp. CFBP9034 TaxID=3096540 RepID=UPI002A6B39B6|nr:DNA-formamidopyrimidine glycosylase family protein [Microbacterium sp. CFBP9034]MDY0911116.1 DNA-formamidopyrimidine glycosylase family protein [Microbacterium sp. CFBP9034]
MPESPEVQALAEFLGEHAAGHAIREVDVLEFRSVKTRAAPPATLVGHAVTGADRHGKHVALAIDDGTRLVVSLGRYGWVRWRDAEAPLALPDDAPPALANFGLDGGDAFEVTDAGTWVSLGLFVVADVADVPAIAKLGPDPADPAFSPQNFEAVLGGRRKQIKAILQEQESIAGIGNAYSDEILHLARVSPVAHAAALDDDTRARLYDATVRTVRDTIDAQRGIPIHLLKAAKVAAMRVHGRGGEACPVCGDTIRDFAFASTTAQYCPTCQTAGAEL